MFLGGSVLPLYGGTSAFLGLLSPMSKIRGFACLYQYQSGVGYSATLCSEWEASPSVQTAPR